MSTCHTKSYRSCRNKKLFFRTLEDIVSDFICSHRKGAEAELNFFRGLPLNKAIEHAALAKDQRGKRFSHQRRLTRENLRSAHRALVEKESALSRTGSFEDVLAIVESVVTSIWGLGTLYAYDTALRLSATRGHEPSVVYLHAGVRVGAKQLRIPANREFIKLDELRPELQRLKAHEVEDLLCLYKNQLGAVR